MSLDGLMMTSFKDVEIIDSLVESLFDDELDEMVEKELQYNKSMKEISLTQHVEQLNEKAKAWMRASPSNGFRMAALYDEKDIEDAQKYHGVTTPAEFDALLAWNDFYDLYKDKHGIKPRWTKWSDNTAEEWEAEIRDL